jgi:hypothetical protein
VPINSESNLNQVGQRRQNGFQVMFAMGGMHVWQLPTIKNRLRRPDLSDSENLWRIGYSEYIRNKGDNHDLLRGAGSVPA